MEGPVLLSTPEVVTKELFKVFNDGELADATILLEHSNEQISFKVHKAILAARSQVFKRLFTESHANAEGSSFIQSLDISCTTYQKFLVYVYTGEVELQTCVEVIELLQLADYYDCDEQLAKTCKEFLHSRPIQLKELKSFESLFFLFTKVPLHNTLHLYQELDQTQDRDMLHTIKPFLHPIELSLEDIFSLRDLNLYSSGIPVITQPYSLDELLSIIQYKSHPQTARANAPWVALCQREGIYGLFFKNDPSILPRKLSARSVEIKFVKGFEKGIPSSLAFSQRFTSGIHEWQVRMCEQVSFETPGYIGIASPKIVMGTSLGDLGASPYAYSFYSRSRFKEGFSIWSSGQSQPFLKLNGYENGDVLKVNTVVRVKLDMDLKKLYFAVDNSEWKIAFSDLPDEVYHPSIGFCGSDKCQPVVEVSGVWVQKVLETIVL